MLGRFNRWLPWAAVIAWMAVIFFFSHQVGEESGGLSDSIVNWLHSLGIHVSPETLSFLVRKAAHMVEYAVLAILLFAALLGTRVRRSIEPRGAHEPGGPRQLQDPCEYHGYLSRGRTLIWAFVITVVYAATDEIHQLFVPGRSGKISDVLIDATGAAIGLALAWLVSRYRKRQARR